MQAGRTRHKILNMYILHDHPLLITDSAKYLGITISNGLKWISYKQHHQQGKQHTWYFTQKPEIVIPHACQALVRPHLKYASAVTAPYGPPPTLQHAETRDGAASCAQDNKAIYIAIVMCTVGLTLGMLASTPHKTRRHYIIYPLQCVLLVGLYVTLGVLASTPHKTRRQHNYSHCNVYCWFDYEFE